MATLVKWKRRPLNIVLRTLLILLLVLSYSSFTTMKHVSWLVVGMLLVGHVMGLTTTLVGPWTAQRTVQLSLSTVTADLVDVVFGPLMPPQRIEVAGADYVLLASQLPTWAIPYNGGGGQVIQTTSLGIASIMITPQGDAGLRLVNSSGMRSFPVGGELGWTEPIRLRFFPGLRQRPADMVLAVVPASLQLDPDTGAPVGVKLSFSTLDCGTTTVEFWTSMWNWADATYATNALHFATRLPVSARPINTVRFGILMKIPAWSALCELVVSPCGSIVIECDALITSPVGIDGDQSFTWASAPLLK